ncbi:hypothetical protein BgiBS90_019029, partial [Biomphalaria glabrata]
NTKMLRDVSLYVNEDWYTPPTEYPPKSNNKERVNLIEDFSTIHQHYNLNQTPV